MGIIAKRNRKQGAAVALPRIKDVGAQRKKAVKKERRNPIAGGIQYIKEVRVEFGKVIWPGRTEIAAAAIVVLITLLFFSIYTGVLDFGFSKIVELILP